MRTTRLAFGRRIQVNARDENPRAARRPRLQHPDGRGGTTHNEEHRSLDFGVGQSASEPVYESLINQPIKTWIQVRGMVKNQTVVGGRVVRSEGGGVFDKAAVQIPNGMVLYTSTVETRIPANVVVHVLIYQLPKGEHAIALAQDDSAGGGNNLLFSNSIRMRFLGLKQ